MIVRTRNAAVKINQLDIKQQRMSRQTAGMESNQTGFTCLLIRLVTLRQP